MRKVRFCAEKRKGARNLKRHEDNARYSLYFRNATVCWCREERRLERCEELGARTEGACIIVTYNDDDDEDASCNIFFINSY